MRAGADGGEPAAAPAADGGLMGEDGALAVAPPATARPVGAGDHHRATGGHRRGRRRTAAAVARLTVVALAFVPTAGALVVAVATATDPSGLVRLLVSAVVYAAVSAIVLSHRRLGIGAITGALAMLSGWLALFAMLRDASDAAPALDAAMLALAHVWTLSELAALGLLPWLVAPDRSLAYRVGVAFGCAPIVLSAAISISALFAPGREWVSVAPFALAVGSFVAGGIRLGHRWARGSERLRTALSWFLVGGALIVVSYVSPFLPLSGVPHGIADAAFVLAQAFLPVGIVAATVERPARGTTRGIALAQSLASAVSAYVLVTVSARALGAPPEIGGAAAAAAMALLFGGSIRSFHERLERLFGNAAPDAREVLGRLGEHVAREPGTDGVRGIASSLRETWRAASVEIALAGSGTVRVGDPAQHSRSAPLVSGGQAIGSITVTAPSRALLHSVVQPVLDRTAGLIAVTVLLATVNEEVAATRRRTLDVRREERRRLHGELHDLLAPALAGIGFGMAGATALVAAGDPRAPGALARLRDEIAACTEDVRQLARALLPTALDQGDLEGALAELAAMSGEELPVAISAHGSDILDTDLQLGLYLMLGEVIALARRVDDLRGVDATVSLDDDGARVRLRLDVPAPVDGVAALAAAVRRRADELGGGCEIGPGVIEAVFRR